MLFFEILGADKLLSVLCLLCRLEDINLNTQHSNKIQGMQ